MVNWLKHKTKQRRWLKGVMTNQLTPFIQQHISKNDTVLDLGCGKGAITNDIICKELTGVDAFKPWLNYYNGSLIAANPSIDFTDLDALKGNFVDIASGKPKYGGVNGADFLGFEPSFCLNPAKGLGLASTNCSAIAVPNFTDPSIAKTSEADRYEQYLEISYL